MRTVILYALAVIGGLTVANLALLAVVLLRDRADERRQARALRADVDAFEDGQW